jgi:hypothetical protein
MKKKITAMIQKDTKFAKLNETFLTEIVEELGNQMQFCGIFELVAKQTDETTKENILTYVYQSFIDGFHENAITQNAYNQLAGQ